MTLTEFLLARIAVDEAKVDGRYQAEELGHPMDDETRWWVTRLEAECQAKRRIVEYASTNEALREKLSRFLALPYADHPGYRDEWKP